MSFCGECGKKFNLLEKKYKTRDLRSLCSNCYEKYCLESKIEEERKELEKLQMVGVTGFITRLGDFNPMVRRGAAYGLGKLNDRRAVEPLIEALKDKDNYVVINAAKSLGNIGDIRALNVLRKLSKRGNIHYKIREEAEQAVKKLKQVKFQGMATIVDADIKDMSWQNFEDKICELLDAVPRDSRTADMGLDGVTKEGIPIQIKQSEKIGRPVVDKFCHAVRRYFSNSDRKKRGIIVAFSFTNGAYEEIERARREDNLDINLVTVEELLIK